MKRKIGRGFSRKIQLKQFEPIEYTAYEEINGDFTNEEATEARKELVKITQDEVEKSLAEYTAPETQQKEISAVEANITVAKKELEVAKRIPDEKLNINEKKFALELYQSLLKQIKGKK